MSEVSAKLFKASRTLPVCPSCGRGLVYDGNLWQGIAYLYCKACDRLWWASRETRVE